MSRDQTASMGVVRVWGLGVRLAHWLLAAAFVVACVTEGDEDVLEAVHEFLANFTLLLVLLHVAGMAASSFAHRENLPRSMITGNKPG